ncbi:MAG: BatA domain-containing protein, partial [Alphaproteobacteria bacterium]|nr:BatA domain-containing protein [Alphaproteobacteria bacterium]
MLGLGSLAFASPWLLIGLAALPIIWWLLRVTPPAPRRVAFPAIRLLLGLVPREETPARTPLWLILLRITLAALVIFAVAHPLLNPQTRLASTGPILVIVHDGWAAARDWQARQSALTNLFAEAEREDRQVVLVTTAPNATNEPSAPLAPIRAADARAAVQTMQPKPWPVDRQATLARLQALSLPEADLAVWLSDGVADAQSGALAAYLAERGSLRYLAAAPAEAPILLAAGDPEANDLGVVVRSLPAPAPRLYQVRASGEDGRLLARQAATIEPGAKRVEVRLPMPSELRNRAARVEIEGDQSAGSVLLLDERWRRRPVGIAAATNAGGQPLLSENYYLERALAPFAEIRRGRASDLLKRELAVLIFSDSGPDSPVEEAAVAKWIEAGGLLLRFAGPHLAEQDDQLLPVRLRRGGRTIGGALSWEQPAKLAPFAPESPFAGLAIPEDVTVSRQVLAEPDLDLANKTWARLADGTPLVTAEKRGQGWIVLVHTTANADWSNLALSGLFVEMLRRTVAMSQGVAAASEEALPPLETLDGFGRLQHASPTARLIAGKELASTVASPQHPPGFYGTADTKRALNLSAGVTELKPIANLPEGTQSEGLASSREIDVRPLLLTAALLVALVDLLIAYVLRGLLRRHPAHAAMVVLAAVAASPT